MLAPADERFWPKVNKTETCWLWTAGCGSDGYGRLYVAGRHVLAHRFAYELLVGPIPEGLQIDHLCRVRLCVNPAHMEPVTQQENIRRGESGRWQLAKTHCPQGHPYDTENTNLYRGMRYCRSCGRANTRAWYARQRGVLQGRPQ